MRHQPTAVRTAFAAVAFAFALLAAPATAQTWTFEAAPGELLEIDLEPGGDVEIRGGAAGQVRVVAEISGRDAADYRITAERTARGVRVEGEIPRRRSTSVDARLTIEVPSEFDLDLASTGGGFSVAGVEGRLTGKTMGGNLSLERVRGSVALSTMGGAVEARDVEASGKIETMGGSLTFVEVRGGLAGSTMGGAVTLEGGGPAELSTMGGKVHVRSAPEGGEVSTMGGDVDVESARAPFSATTMGGDLAVRIDGGDGEIDLRSMSGDVEVWLPGDFAGDFEVELVQTRGRDGAYTIDSDFVLERNRSERRATSRGDYEREVVWEARGRNAGGGNRVRIETVNGDIRIRRAG